MRVGVAVVAVAALLAAGCGDDDAATDDSAIETPGEDSAATVDPHSPTTTVPLATGDLDIDVPDGFAPVPLVSFGVGLALPEDWQAVVLTDEAIERVDELGIVPGFVAAARNARSAGAVLYAAGPESVGVADLKLQRIPQRAAEPGSIGAAELAPLAASALDAAPEGATLDEELGREPPRARVRFRTSGAHVEAEGTQWLVAGPEEVWSLIITSEDPDAHDELAEAIVDTVTFASPQAPAG